MNQTGLHNDNEHVGDDGDDDEAASEGHISDKGMQDEEVYKGLEVIERKKSTSFKYFKIPNLGES